MDKLKCHILSALDDDYVFLWEVLYDIKTRLNLNLENDLDLVYSSFRALFSDGFIYLYQGTNFNGEEQQIDDNIFSKEFMLDQQYKKWINKKDKSIEYKICISDNGLDQWLNNCPAEFFN